MRVYSTVLCRSLLRRIQTLCKLFGIGVADLAAGEGLRKSHGQTVEASRHGSYPDRRSRHRDLFTDSIN